MTVRDLIAALSDLDPDSLVVHAVPTGDYWRTVAAPSVVDARVEYVKRNERIEENELVDAERVEDEEMDANGDIPGYRQVVVLR